MELNKYSWDNVLRSSQFLELGLDLVDQKSPQNLSTC